MSVKIHLDPKRILQKQFDSKMRGYDKAEVDNFLDFVIQDYNTFTKTDTHLRNEVIQLRNEVNRLTKEKAERPVLSRTIRNNDKVAPSDNAKYVNIVKRLSRLESYVATHRGMNVR